MVLDHSERSFSLELLFLGTGAGIPAKLRNVTSIALKTFGRARINLVV